MSPGSPTDPAPELGGDNVKVPSVSGLGSVTDRSRYMPRCARCQSKGGAFVITPVWLSYIVNRPPTYSMTRLAPPLSCSVTCNGTGILNTACSDRFFHHDLRHPCLRLRHSREI